MAGLVVGKASKAIIGNSVETVTSSLLVGKAGWTWFQEPRAFRYTGTHDRVYGATQRPVGDLYAFQLDLGSGAVSEFALSAGFERDDHDNPSIAMFPDTKKLIAFYCPHGAGPLRFRRSTNPEDATAWDAQVSVPSAVNSATGTSGYTYPNLAILTGEGTGHRLYVFFRGQNFYPCFAYSDDYGDNWTGPSGANNSAWQLIAGGADREYVKLASNGTDRIDVLMTTGHPDSVNTDLYHCYIQAGVIKKTDGTTIRASFAALAASPMAVTELTKVYDHTTDGRAWASALTYDPATGRPVCAFAADATPGTGHHYYRAHWDGSAWVNVRIGSYTTSTIYVLPNPNLISAAAEDYYDGIVVLDEDDPTIAYLAHDTSGVFEIAKATAPITASPTWTDTPITSGHSAPRKQYRPAAVRNHGTNCPRMLWLDGSYDTFSDWEAALRCYPAIPGVTQPAEPVNTVAPAVTGTVTVGQTLTCSNGTWTGTPSEYRFQWCRNGTAIPGFQRNSTYVLVAGDVGTTVTCRVYALNAGGIGGVAVSNGVTP